MQLASTSPSYVAEAAQDLRVALRRMRRAPAIATAIVLTTALGLGAAAAIFTTFKAALVDPLPYAEPDRLVSLGEVRTGTEERSSTSYPTLMDWRSRANSFSGLEGYDPANLTVGVGDDARMLRGAQLTSGFFRLLGVEVAAGRDFLPDEDATPASGVVIVSERFARSIGTAALNHVVSVNGSPHVVVGVLPGTFHFALLQDADIFMPLIVNEERRTDRSARSIAVLGRLKGDLPIHAARAELAAVMLTLASEHPDALGGRTVAAAPLRDAFLGTMKPILGSLLLAVAFLLVIVAANLALLMLARYVERAPELAMRSALGATRGRVLRQLLVESLAPALVGAALAAAVGHVTASVIIATIPESVRSGAPFLVNASIDARTVAVILGVAIVLAIAFGLGPAFVVTKVRAHAGDARTTVSRGDRRLRRGLVAAQMALTVVLLVSSGLLIMSFRNLVTRDVGFTGPESLVVARAPLSGPRYSDARAQQQFYEALMTRLAVIPGVRSASAINEVPGGGGGTTTFHAVDRPRPRSQQPGATLRIVGGDYFGTMGIRVSQGRALDERDRADAPRVAVVSASFAKLLAQDGGSVGRRLRLSQTDDIEWEVVGVAGDVQVAALDLDSPPVIYLSHLQAQENRMTLVMRTEMGVASIANQLRALVKSIDPGIPVYGVATLDQQLGESRAIFTRRLPMILCGIFAAAALALTLVALYAICMHEVQTRGREFGIRMALGSTPGSIRRLILNDAILVGVAGIVIGGLVAVVVSRSMRAVLFGITATDWRVYGIVTMGVLVAAVLATLRPAMRAGLVNPATVMRQE